MVERQSGATGTLCETSLTKCLLSKILNKLSKITSNSLMEKIVKNDQMNGFHAVLSVKVGHQFYILDNRTNRIKTDVTLKNLRLIHAFIKPVVAL